MLPISFATFKTKKRFCGFRDWFHIQFALQRTLKLQTQREQQQHREHCVMIVKKILQIGADIFSALSLHITG